VELDVPATAQRLRAARRIVVTTHARADPDAIGSAAALARVLRLSGQSTQAYVHEPLPPPYRFLGELEPIRVWEPAAASAVLADCDLLVIVDTCARGQLGEVLPAIEAAPIPKLAIDHHQTRDPIVDACLIDPQ